MQYYPRKGVSLAAKVGESTMQSNAFGSIKPAQLPCGLLILFRSGQNSGWKIGSCGVHVCELEQKTIRMGNRANAVTSQELKVKAKDEVAPPAQSAPPFSRCRGDGLEALFVFFLFTNSWQCHQL